MVGHYLDQLDHLNALVTALDQRIADALAEQREELDRLDTIPGVGRLAAQDRVWEGLIDDALGD